MSFDYEEARRDIIDAGGDPDYLDYYHADKRDEYLRKVGLNPKNYGSSGNSHSSSDNSFFDGGSDGAESAASILGLLLGLFVVSKENSERKKAEARTLEAKRQQQRMKEAAEAARRLQEEEEDDDWEEDEEEEEVDLLKSDEELEKEKKIRDDLYYHLISLEDKTRTIKETEEQLISQYEPAIKAIEELKNWDDVIELDIGKNEDLKREIEIKTILRRLIRLNPKKGFELWKDALLRCGDLFFDDGGGETGLLCVYQEGNKAMTDFIAQDEEVRNIFFSKTTYSVPAQAVVIDLLKDNRFAEADLCLGALYNNKERFPWEIEFDDTFRACTKKDFSEEVYQFADRWIEKTEDESERNNLRERLNDWVETEKEIEAERLEREKEKEEEEKNTSKSGPAIVIEEKKRKDMSDIQPGKYRHFKGNEYEVLYIAKHSETGEDMVVYRALYGEGGVWVRPASMWNETVERDGKVFKRFERVE